MAVVVVDLEGWVDFVVCGDLILVSRQISAEGRRLLEKELSYRPPRKQIEPQSLCYVPAQKQCPM